MRLPAALVILLLVSGCDRGAPDNQAATAEPAKAPLDSKPAESKPSESKPTESAKRAKPKDLSAKQASDLAKQFRIELDEGRALTKAGKHEAGIERYHAALAIEPSNPAALAELGWAALQAKQLDLAQGATSRALIFSRKPDQQGMILYNLGRVAEARSDAPQAILHYRESLERRPNKTVQARLDGLLTTASAVAAPAEGLEQIASGVADLGAACKLLADSECANLYTMGEDGCTCRTALGAEREGWALLELGENDTVSNAMWFPAVQTTAGWVVFETVAGVYNPGMFGIYEDAKWATPEFADLLPGGDSEWVLAFSKDRSDSDMGLNEFETESYGMTLVCAREAAGAEAWCTRPILRDYSYARAVQFEGEEYEGADAIVHEGLPIKVEFSCAVELGAKLVVTNVVGLERTTGGWLADIQGLPAGEYELTTLLGKP